MSRSVIGIDVGSSAVRAAQVKVSRRGKPKILRAGEIPLPIGAVVGGEVREPAAIENALKLLWKRAGFQRRDVAVAVSSKHMLVRQIDVVLDAGEDLRVTLPEKVAPDLPIDANELMLDYYQLEDYLDTRSRHHRKALLVGALSASVENLAETVADAKLKPSAIDFGGFSLVRSAVYCFGDPSNIAGPLGVDDEVECEVVIDMGAQLTTIAIHYRGRPLYIRMSSGGGDSVTRAIADHLSLRWEVADAIKRKLGIGGLDPDRATAKLVSEAPASAIPVAQQITNMMASSLVQNVRETVDYFLAASPQVLGVSRTVLSGGGTLLPGYANRIASELKSETVMMAPIAQFSSGRRAKKFASLDPRFSTAVGLGLGGR